MREWLRLIRIDNRLTQEQIATLLNISRSSYNRYETGKRTPNPVLAQRIAKEMKFDWTLFYK